MTFPHATLHQLEIFTPNPAALAEFYARALGMRPAGSGGGLLCTAPGRQLRLREGPVGQLRSATFRCRDRAAFECMRQALREHGVPFEEDTADALGVSDPEGRLLRFTVQALPDASQLAAMPAGRLQHFAVRTPDPESLLAFYVDVMGFALSDRVEDDSGRLAAAFVRCDEEHHALAIFRAAEARFDHFSCETADWTALRDWADHMASAGIELAWGIGRHGPGNDTFFMVRDPDGNMAELSAELEVCHPARPAGVWPHRPSTLNRWGVAIMRS